MPEELTKVQVGHITDMISDLVSSYLPDLGWVSMQRFWDWIEGIEKHAARDESADVWDKGYEAAVHDRRYITVDNYRPTKNPYTDDELVEPEQPSVTQISNMVPGTIVAGPVGGKLLISLDHSSDSITVNLTIPRGA